MPNSTISSVSPPPTPPKRPMRLDSLPLLLTYGYIDDLFRFREFAAVLRAAPCTLRSAAKRLGWASEAATGLSARLAPLFGILFERSATRPVELFTQGNRLTPDGEVALGLAIDFTNELLRELDTDSLLRLADRPGGRLAWNLRTPSG